MSSNPPDSAILRSPPVPIKQTLVIVNEFIISTSRFLSHFSQLAEEKLLDTAQKIERVETALVLLEGRLSRIPGMEDPYVAPPTSISTVVPESQVVKPTVVTSAPEPIAPVSIPPIPPAPSSVLPDLPPVPAAPPAPTEIPAAPQVVEAPPPPAAPTVTLAESELYGPFFKMLRLGIPPPAVKMKFGMVNPGADASLLDLDPSTPYTGGAVLDI